MGDIAAETNVLTPPSFSPDGKNVQETRDITLSPEAREALRELIMPLPPMEPLMAFRRLNLTLQLRIRDEGVSSEHYMHLIKLGPSAYAFVEELMQSDTDKEFTSIESTAEHLLRDDVVSIMIPEVNDPQRYNNAMNRLLTFKDNNPGDVGDALGILLLTSARDNMLSDQNIETVQSFEEIEANLTQRGIL